MILLKKQMSAVLSSLLVSVVAIKATAANIDLTPAQNQAMQALEEDLLVSPGVHPLNKTTRM